mmetsp:Transcript_15150/g.40786  ORF Transcript_15150/g.40786 Transcript_15150/m.40786 type:complete len:502 (+) Transcript_15150:22-1527(+)
MGSRLASRLSALAFPSRHTLPAPLLLVPFKPSRMFSAARSGPKHLELNALPFTVSPHRAIAKFFRWVKEEQGIHYIVSSSSTRVAACYVPVWSFDLNIRFRSSDAAGPAVNRWTGNPPPFDVYRADTVHVPGMSAYAGYNFMRPLVDPVHNTSLVFLGAETKPFASWMLDSMRLPNGNTLNIDVDPWNAPQSRALEVIVENLESLESGRFRGGVHVQVERARRVLMPTYVFSYTILGAEYQAFSSGCDVAGSVSGRSHKVWSSSSQLANQSTSFLQESAKFALQSRQLRQILGAFVLRVLSRFPVFTALGGGFVAFRKVIQPWITHRTASAEWEQQRLHESTMEDMRKRDDFADNGEAVRYFVRNRAEILRHLGGKTAPVGGDFEWFHQWVRQQRESQQHEGSYQGQQRQQYGREQQQQQQPSQQRSRRDTKWDFDPSDPYSVLGIQRGASKQEVSQAFRREMLKHHPDTQAGATEAAKKMATERTQMITEAYQTIKKTFK